MQEGKIIEFIDQGRFVCTLCVQDKGNRLHLLTSTNREMSLSSKRALVVSAVSVVDPQQSRDEQLSRLKQAETRQQQDCETGGAVHGSPAFCNLGRSTSHAVAALGAV